MNTISKNEKPREIKCKNSRDTNLKIKNTYHIIDGIENSTSPCTWPEYYKIKQLKKNRKANTEKHLPNFGASVNHVGIIVAKNNFDI